MERAYLPTPSDLSVSSYDWASSLLGEPVEMLIMGPEAARVSIGVIQARIIPAGLITCVDDSVANGQWGVRGATREVWSEDV